MNSKEAKDKAYAKGDAEGRSGGYGFFERLVDGNVDVIMTKDEKELHDINIKGKIHGADERAREKAEAFFRPSPNKPSSKSESPSTSSNAQYEPSDRGSYSSDYGSYYGGGSGVSSSRSGANCPGDGMVIGAVIIIGLIIAAIVAYSKWEKPSIPSRPIYNSAAHYYPQSSPVVNARSVKQPNSRSNEDYHPAQTNQEYSDTLGKEESGTTQSDGGNVVKSDPLVTASAQTVSATSETAAVENVDLNEADWPNLNELREAVESQSGEIDKALDILNGGGN